MGKNYAVWVSLPLLLQASREGMVVVCVCVCDCVPSGSVLATAVFSSHSQETSDLYGSCLLSLIIIAFFLIVMVLLLC